MPTNAPLINVSADGEVFVKPDMAMLTIGVVTQNASASDALQENSTLMNKVMDGLKKSGVEERDLQTSGLSIYEMSVQKNNKSSASETDGNTYQVTNNLTIRIRQLDQLGKLLDETVRLGVNRSSNLTLTNADTKPLFEQARKQAVENAFVKAKTLAEAAHVKLGSVVEIQENDSPNYPVMARASLAQSYDSVTPVAGGEVGYKINVTVKFSIAQ